MFLLTFENQAQKKKKKPPRHLRFCCCLKDTVLCNIIFLFVDVLLITFNESLVVGMGVGEGGVNYISDFEQPSFNWVKLEKRDIFATQITMNLDTKWLQIFDKEITYCLKRGREGVRENFRFVFCFLIFFI